MEASEEKNELDLKYHELARPIYIEAIKFVDDANLTYKGWNDDLKNKFFESSIIPFCKEYDTFLSETNQIVELMASAEELSKDFLKATAGMGTTIGSSKFLSLFDINVIVRRQFSKIFSGDGWGS